MHRPRRGPAQLSDSSPAPVRLVRDRATWAVYGIFAAWGWFLYAFNPSVPLIGRELGVSAAVAGLHGTALAAGTVGAGLLQAPLAVRIGRRGTIVLGGAAVLLSLLLVTASGALWGTLGGAVVAGMGGTLMLNAGNVVLSEKHGAASSAAITEANGLGALVGALAPVTLGAVVAGGLGWQPALLVVGALIVVVLVSLPPLPAPAQAPAGSSGGHLPSRYWWAWGVLVALIAVEFSYTVWGSTLVAERTGVSVGTATGSLTVLILGLGVGRAVGSRLALRFSPGVLLLGAIALTAVGWVLLWTATSLVTAVAALAVSGLGMALHFPLAISRSLEASAGRPDLAAGRGSLGAGLAIGAAPFALGALTDLVGVQRAFLLIPALLLLAALLLTAGRLTGRRAPVT